MLTQSDESNKMFIDSGCKTEFLPSGVDTKKFVPASRDIKEKLREKYGIDKKKFVILHVGSIKKGRGIEIFKKIQTKRDQVLILGNKSMGIEKQVYQSIKEEGCKIWVEYFSNIEEIYALSDCYIFPTSPTNRISSIETPLSILEAMSCNLPVITTKFGALPRIFDEGHGLIFAETEEEFSNKLKEIKNGDVDVRTRDEVLPYSWKNVGERLERIYDGLTFNSGGDDR